MARTKAVLTSGARLVDYLTVGFLVMQCPLEKVRKALDKHGAQSKRNRGLPHEVLVYGLDPFALTHSSFLGSAALAV